MKNILLLLAILSLASCSSKANKNQENSKQETASYKLELVWESDSIIKTPESVLIDHKRNILYVSCINENPWGKDGNGYITKMSMSGEVTDLKWIEGLSAPKGMGISGNSLFIADISELVEVDINSGEIINRITVEGNPQLNDITTGDKGEIYVSGSGSQKIYKLKNSTLTPIFSGEEGERFNGLFWEKDRLLLLTSASSQFKAIDWNTMEAKLISENMGHGDAICPVGNGAYITTSWKGAVFYVSPTGETTELLNTEAIGENAADADFCTKEQILYLPTFFKNQVKAYRLIKN